MLIVNQLTPDILFENRNHLDDFLKEELGQLVNKNTWITDWEKLAHRFKLHQFKSFSESEIAKLQWDTDKINSIIVETFQNVSTYLNYDVVRITVVPALPLSFFKNHPQSLWTNGFTNGPGNILIAIPSHPDIDFFQYLLAHELHHATPENPIYQLSLNTFTLEEWYKMEGTAEYFSLSLYPDKRWWKDNFPIDVESKYWNECKEHLKSTDDFIKGPLCFGNPKRGIPIFSGYSFALKLVSNYVSTRKINKIKELFAVEPSEFIECYKSNFVHLGE